MLFRLHNVLCRYTLAATDDGPFVAIDKISGWITSHLGSRGIPINDIPPDPNDFDEVPVFCDALIARLNLSGDSRLDRRIAPVLVGFMVHYYYHSASCLNDSSLLLFKAIFNRAWLEITDDRCAEDLQYRLASMDLVISILRAPFILF